MDRLAHVAAQWDAEAAEYDGGFDHTIATPAERGAWDRILSILDGGQRALRVLDLGCGTGFLALEFAARGHQVIGVDVSPLMLERAREKASAAGVAITFAAGDATNPPVAGPFDLIVSRHLFWALPGQPAALRTWQSLLAPTGRIAIIDGDWSPGSPGSLSMESAAHLLTTTTGGPTLADPLLDLRAALASRAAATGLARPSFDYYLVATTSNE